MSFRFRLGPLTFGRTGVRLSLWRRGFGLSVPLSGRGQSFGKIALGPLSNYFRGSPKASLPTGSGEVELEMGQYLLGFYSGAAIKAAQLDQQFLNKIRQHGLPWRGVQERLKEEFPDNFPGRDEIAYDLVPQAMGNIFGQQNVAWKTEKRLSKSGGSYTTWIVIIETGA